MLRFVDVEYCWGSESVLNRLEMAFNRIEAMLYIIDILYYTIFYNYWGIGVESCKYLTKKFYCPIVKRVFWKCLAFRGYLGWYKI